MAKHNGFSWNVSDNMNHVQNMIICHFFANTICLPSPTHHKKARGTFKRAKT